MSYSHLSAVERGKIELLHGQGWSAMAIGREIGRHHTTVSREIARNGISAGYKAETAQTRYVERRTVCRPRPRLAHAALRNYVVEKIAQEEWTPDLVAGRLRKDFPEDPRMRICAESIYQAIYTNRYKLDFLVVFLPQARPKRRRRGQGKARRGPSIPNRRSIHERPETIERREEIGHWEGDLVVGKNQEGFIATLVERHSRRAVGIHLRTKHAPAVAEALIQGLQDHPISWVRTITFDNGTEFADHQTLTKQLGADVYFADPYAAYQRGTNEQFNGLLRRYLPKGTSFANLEQSKLDRIINQLNNRPRKCLAYQTPNEVFLKQREEHRRALSS